MWAQGRRPDVMPSAMLRVDRVCLALFIASSAMLLAVIGLGLKVSWVRERLLIGMGLAGLAVYASGYCFLVWTLHRDAKEGATTLGCQSDNKLLPDNLLFRTEQGAHARHMRRHDVDDQTGSDLAE